MRSRRIICIGLTLILGILLLLTGARWLQHQRMRTVSVPILMYHRIGNEVDSPWWVTVQDFETQLRSLREQGYSSVWPSDLAAHQRWGWPLPRKPILLTFDDGYLNMTEQAEPLLRKYGFKAVCYLITGRIGDAPATRQSWEGTPLLIWPEVQAAYRRGTIRFGGHSRTHPNLRALPESHQEIASCYRDLQRKGRLVPEGFCFPYGQYKDETLTELARSKFTTATTCTDGIAELKPGAPLFELPRVSVMGGWHRFRIQPSAGPTNTMTIGVAKEGRELEVTPKLVWDDGTFKWLPRVRITSSPSPISYASADGQKHPAPVLELWDDFHVILHYRAPLPGP